MSEKIPGQNTSESRDSRGELLDQARVTKNRIDEILETGSFEDLKALKPELQKMIDLINQNS